MLAFCKRVCNFFQHCETSVASFFFSEIEGAFCNPTSTSSHLKVSSDSLAFHTYHSSSSLASSSSFSSTSTSSNLKVSLDSLAFDTYHLSPSSIKPTPFKTNIDYYRGKTKSIYEKEPIFRDFARNIPLSQSLDDSSSLHELKRDFQKLVSARDPVLGRPDPLKPSAVGAIVQIQIHYLPRTCSLRN